jgi:hypothetical protein
MPVWLDPPRGDPIASASFLRDRGGARTDDNGAPAARQVQQHKPVRAVPLNTDGLRAYKPQVYDNSSYSNLPHKWYAPQGPITPITAANGSSLTLH